MLFSVGLWLCRPHQYGYHLIKILCFPGNPVGICCMIIRIRLERTLFRDNNFITAKALVCLWYMSGSNNRAVLMVKKHVAPCSKYILNPKSCFWIPHFFQCWMSEYANNLFINGLAKVMTNSIQSIDRKLPMLPSMVVFISCNLPINRVNISLYRINQYPTHFVYTSSF